MIPEFACRLGVLAFTEHHAKAVAREETPLGGVNRALSKSEDVDVVRRGYCQVANGQTQRESKIYAMIANNFSMTRGRKLAAATTDIYTSELEIEFVR